MKRIGFAFVGMLSLFSLKSLMAAPIQISVFDPVQIVDKTEDIQGVRWNFFYGVNANVTGFDFGTFSQTAGDFKGVQANVLNLVQGNGKGVSLGALTSISGDYSGWAHGTFFNYTGGIHRGVQTGIFNFSGEMRGVQFGVVNHSVKLHGVQLGVINSNAAGKPLKFMPFLLWSFA